MFDVSWSELLILAIVTLIFVGPKELPVFLGTLGRYAGMVRKQATEFRRHFDDAMREAELDQMRKDMETMARDVNDSVMSATRSAELEMNGAKVAVESASVAPAVLPPPDGELPAVETPALPEAVTPQAGVPQGGAVSDHD